MHASYKPVKRPRTSYPQKSLLVQATSGQHAGEAPRAPERASFVGLNWAGTLIMVMAAMIITMVMMMMMVK